MKAKKIKYPEVNFSRLYLRIANSTPEIETPAEPTAPKMPFEPDKPEGRTGCLLVPVVFIIIAFVAGPDLFNAKIALLILITSVISIFMYKTGVWDKRKYKEEMKAYHLKKTSYENDLKSYEVNKKKYQEKLTEYEQESKGTLSTSNLIKHRRALYDNQVRPYYFETCTDSDKVKKGVAEDSFYPYLENIRGVTIHRNCKIKAGNTYYYPDFVIEDKVNNFLFDIEIDEPYEIDEGRPIHYQKGNRYNEYVSVDEIRNDFFTNNNWFVIRFSEEQTLKNPNDCIKFIKKVLKNCSRFKLGIPKCNIKVKKWTKKRAYKLAYENYRDTYLY